MFSIDDQQQGQLAVVRADDVPESWACDADNLTVVERQRWQRLRLRDASASQCFLKQRGWLRRQVAQWVPDPHSIIWQDHIDGGLTLSCGSGGISLSHSADYWALAYAPDGQVGVDLEVLHLKRPGERIARRFFTHREQAFLQAIDDPQQRHEAFMMMWVRKEAWVKCLRLPLGRHLKQIETVHQDWREQWQGVHWSHVRKHGWIAAVAYRQA